MSSPDHWRCERLVAATTMLPRAGRRPVTRGQRLHKLCSEKGLKVAKPGWAASAAGLVAAEKIAGAVLDASEEVRYRVACS
jgi:hypothetical protein